MKWILAILLLISATVNAQIGLRDDSTKYIHYKYQYGSRMPRFWADSALHIPYYDTAIVKPQKAGAIMMHLDKNVYKWNGGGWEALGGASITLNNVGTGHRLVATPGGNIKTIVFGYGVNGDSTTNANSITVVADTSELVTPSDLNDAIAGAPAPSWQQTLNVSNTTSSTLLHDTAMVGNPVEKLWNKYEVLNKSDTATTAFYHWQFSGSNNGSYNEVMGEGWNVNAGGGTVEAGKPGMGEFWESNYQTNPLWPMFSNRYMEKHEVFVTRSGTQHRLSSYTIDVDLNTINYYHTVGSFSLHAIETHTPYYSIQGVNDATEFSLINKADQTESFHFGADFNQDANTANYTITSGSGKPITLFNLINFNNAYFPDLSLTGRGYDGAEIRFNGTTTGLLGRFLVDSANSNFSTFTNVPILFSPNGTTALELRNSRVNLLQPTGIGTAVTTPIAQLDVRKSSGFVGYFGGANGNVVAIGDIGGNDYGYLNYSSSDNSFGVQSHPTVDLSFGNGTERMRIKTSGKVGIATATPDSTLQINGSFHNNAGVRMEGLPTGPGTKAVRIDANGTLSVADTTVGGGITSINGHTGSAITVQGGTALSVDNGTPDVVTFNVTPNSSALPHTLDAVYTTVGNTGTGETDLFTYTLPAGELAIDGRTMNFEIDGEFNDNTITAQLKLYFGGNVTLNTGAVSVSTAFSKWRIKGYIMRTSSSTAHVTYEMHAPGLATPVFLSYNNLTSLDFTTTNVFKISAQAAGGGASNSDITAHSWQLLYKPQPQ